MYYAYLIISVCFNREYIVIDFVLRKYNVIGSERYNGYCTMMQLEISLIFKVILWPDAMGSFWSHMVRDLDSFSD